MSGWRNAASRRRCPRAWQAWAAGTLEANLAYESSTIAQQGDADSSLTLRYWKPRLNATIAPFRDWEVRLRAERTVSQLDFEDYASTASLDTGTVNAGNPDLVPEQAWVFEAAIEHHFWSRGALTLTASHAAISNAIDLVADRRPLRRARQYRQRHAAGGEGRADPPARPPRRAGHC